MFQTSLAVLQSIENRALQCEATVDHYAQLFFKQEGDEFIAIKRPPRSLSLSAEGTVKVILM